MTSRRGHRPASVPGRARSVVLLLTRQLRQDPWVSVLLAAVVLLACLLATTGPRLMHDMNSRQVPYVLNDLSAMSRDVTAGASAWVIPPGEGQSHAPGAGTQDWSLLADNLEQVRESQPEPLRSVLQPGGVYAEWPPTPAAPAPPGSGIGALTLTLRLDPDLREHVDLVRGEWPEAIVNRDSLRGQSLVGRPASDELPSGEFELIPVVLLESAAHQLNWQIGDRWGAVLLTGTYQPRDPDDPRWAHARNSTGMGTVSAEGGRIGTATGYLAPESTGLVDTAAAELRVRAYLPVDTAELPGDEVGTLLRQVRQLGAGESVLLPEGEVGPVHQGVVATLDTEALATIQGLVDEQRATLSLLAVLTAGPVGVLGAVLLLGARLIQVRRAGTVGLAVARGASPGQVRAVLAVEGLLIGLPAALLGRLAADQTVGASGVSSEWVVVAAIGLLPAVALLVTSGRGRVRQVRRDLRSRPRARGRAIAEMGLLAVAGLAAWRLLTRGLTGGQGAGPDPLLAVTPLLVALVACVVTMRLYPVLVHGLLALLRRRRGLSGFLGVAGALRNPSAGLLPALSVILAVAVAVSSVVLASTVTRGASAAVWETAGAQIRASGPTMGLEQRRAIRDVEGVAEVATAREISRSSVLSGGIDADGVHVVVIDDEMEQVSAGAGPLPPLPAELFEQRRPAPVLTVGALTAQEGTAHLRTYGAVEVIGHLPTLPGVLTRGETVVMSVSNWQSVRENVSSGSVALVSLTGEVPADEVTDEVAGAVPTALIETPELQEEAFQEAPVTAGLLWAFLAIVLVGVVLTVVAILLAHQLGARSRARMLSVLRTLGMAPRQGRGLTAWELGPLVAAALLVGVVAGLSVPWLLLRSIDLTGLTSGAAQPDLVLDLGLLALVLAAVVLAVCVAIVGSTVLASRSDLAQQLRIGDEG